MKEKKRQSTICKVCKSEAPFLFKSKVLNKYFVNYFQCIECRFIQTEEPFWLDEAYSSAIGILDIGLLSRNNAFSNSIPEVLEKFSSSKDSYLDYGGGYGVFVRMMRDKGYDFYLYDKYCENLHARFFEIEDHTNKKFKALTAFEVFEHLVDPIQEISKMWEYSNVLIFSTELQPNISFNSDKDWWYFATYGGQHISLYHSLTLKKLSEIFKCKVYSNGVNLHILTKLDFGNPFTMEKKTNKFERLFDKFLSKKKPGAKFKRNSLLMKDFEFYKNKLENK